MRTFGLIGYPLGHSASREYFEKKFNEEHIEDASYRLFELKDIKNFPGLLNETPGLAGLNVTLPYKQAIMPFLDALDPEARSIGAVNCISIEPSGDRIFTKGFNTDAEGFKQTLLPLLKPHHKRALVLGTGGGARAVGYVLNQLGISHIFVSRHPGAGNEIAYEKMDEELVEKHSLVVNATPVGMFPLTDQCPPLPYHALGDNHLLYDLVYNPTESLFLKMGKKARARIKNGMEMLILQAEYAWEVWNGTCRTRKNP